MKYTFTEKKFFDELMNGKFLVYFDEEETTENPTDKVRFINESIEKLRTVMIRVRTLQSIHVIHKKGFGAIVREEANVARQLKGWAKKTMSDA